jgi:hypothetical protein
MAEFYDDEVMRARNIRALIQAAKPKPATGVGDIRKSDESTAKDVTPTPTPTPVSVASIRKADEDTTRDIPVSVPVSAAESPTLSVSQKPTREERMAQLKQARESNYFTKQSLLKGEKPTVPAEDADYTYDYVWHVFAGGGGEWRLVRYPKYKPMGSGNGNNGNGNNGDGNNGNGNNGNGNNGNGNNGNGNNGNGDGTGDGSTTKLTTNIDVLKSLLRGMGFGMSLIDSSADYLNRLLKDGLDYDNAIAIFLDSKEYTFKDGKKVTSPFYTAYGYLNEGLTVPKSASELFNAVEGYKEVVGKYALSDKYLSSDSLKKYVKNNVSVSELDERANAARLKAVNADKSYTDALQALGYIKSPTDLTDFFLNPDIGKEVLEQNRATAAFSAEAIRRAQQGIKFDAARFGKIAAGLVGMGLSEAKIGVTAAEGFENIAQQLAPTQKLSGIYENLPAYDVASQVDAIQQELEAEQFLGTASERRKKLKAQEEAAFQRSAGTTTASLRGARAGII